MLKQITQNVAATIDMKDGPTIADLALHSGTSVLTTLMSPSQAVKWAVCEAVLNETGQIISYESAERIFIAGITAAGRE